MGSIGEKRVREDEGGVGSEKEKRSVTETACSDLTDSVGDGAGVVMKALSKGERERRIADAIQTVLECLEEDPSREGLRKTPSRYAKALMDFTNGYRMSLREVVGDAEFEESHSEIVFLSNVEVHSLCEHHMVPFHGKVSSSAGSFLLSLLRSHVAMNTQPRFIPCLCVTLVSHRVHSERKSHWTEQTGEDY
uniref:GTP cyclohydrolase 1 n=1 Tax=Rhodosorus marinus TaxID=101924 RepID=A0A7S2ZEL4_9RHOD|mmetsp:Transcript_14154/g.56929  ORF Transcript_14154/g.56929 Transcript_14154/m.56929 type:complete len:192 (+) Transcript_14154:131-706(+)